MALKPPRRNGLAGRERRATRSGLTERVRARRQRDPMDWNSFGDAVRLCEEMRMCVCVCVLILIMKIPESLKAIY